MPKYLGIIGAAGVTIMPGYVTPGVAAAVVSNPAATKPSAAWKDHFILAPVQNTALTVPAGTSGGMTVPSMTQLMSGISISAATFYSVGSFCFDTAFTKATKVSIDKFRGSLKRSASHKYFVDAYNSGGTRVSSTALGTYVGLASSWINPAATFAPGLKSVTVPANGFLAMRAIGNGGTSSGIKFTTGWTAGGISPAFILITTETAASGGSGVVSAVENRERFYDSKGVPLPDGTKVYEYNSATMQYTGNYGLIGGVAGNAVSPGITSLFVAGATGVTGVAVSATSDKVASANGSYTFSVVANAANFDLSVIHTAATGGTGVAQVFASANLAATGLVVLDGGASIDVAGVLAAGVGGSFDISGAGSITDAAVAVAATGVGEVVFTRSGGDAGEYFYIVPDPASGITWSGATTFAVGDKVNPGSVSKLFAQVQSVTTGTSAPAAPVWPTTSGSTVVDGGVTWVMVDVETICTNAITGYQLGKWSPGMSAVIGSRIAPAGSGQYALASSLPGTVGEVSQFSAGTGTGLTAVNINALSTIGAGVNGVYNFTTNAGGDLLVTKVGGVLQTFLAASLAAGNMIYTTSGLHFDIIGTALANGIGGSFTVKGSAVIVAATPVVGGFAAGTTGLTGVAIDVTNVQAVGNNGSYTITSNLGGDLIFTKGAGVAQTVLAAALAGPFTLTDGALTISVTGTVLANGSGGTFSVGAAAGGTAGAAEPVWPTGIISGTTTAVDGNVVWTMYTNTAYV